VVCTTDVKTEKVRDLAWGMKAQDLSFTVGEHLISVHEPVDNQAAIAGLVSFAKDVLSWRQVPHPVI
jgi:hypothetical protein